jgi:lysozyme
VNREALKAQLVKHEGLRLKSYGDSIGKLTIGCGHNLDDKPISMRAAMLILDDDMDDAIADLDRALPWWRSMSEPRQIVLADMTFNMGIARLKLFHHALQAMQDGKWDEAASQMLDSRWAQQVGQRANTLADMMRVG